MKARPWALGWVWGAGDVMGCRSGGHSRRAGRGRKPARAAKAAAAAACWGHLGARARSLLISACSVPCPLCSLASTWWRSSGRSGRSSMSVRGWGLQPWPHVVWPSAVCAACATAARRLPARCAGGTSLRPDCVDGSRSLRWRCSALCLSCAFSRLRRSKHWPAVSLTASSLVLTATPRSPASHSTTARRLQGAERLDQGVVSRGGSRRRRHQLLAAHDFADGAASGRPPRLWCAKRCMPMASVLPISGG